MAKRLKQVKIRIIRERLEALYSICDDMLQEFKPENETEHLMREYLKELHHQLYKKMALNQSMYTLHMSGTEAVAFRQLWNVLCIKNDKYAAILVRSILGQIDRYNEEQIFS